MIIRMTVFWTDCTQNYIAMHNLKCAIQMMVRIASGLPHFVTFNPPAHIPEHVWTYFRPKTLEVHPFCFVRVSIRIGCHSLELRGYRSKQFCNRIESVAQGKHPKSSHIA